MFQGTAKVLEDPEAEAAEPGMEEVRWQMGKKYAGGHGEPAEPRKNESTARGRHWRWVVFTPTRTVTWDRQENPAVGRRRARFRWDGLDRWSTMHLW